MNRQRDAGGKNASHGSERLEPWQAAGKGERAKGEGMWQRHPPISEELSLEEKFRDQRNLRYSISI